MPPSSPDTPGGLPQGHLIKAAYLPRSKTYAADAAARRWNGGHVRGELRSELRRDGSPAIGYTDWSQSSGGKSQESLAVAVTFSRSNGSSSATATVADEAPYIEMYGLSRANR